MSNLSHHSRAASQVGGGGGPGTLPQLGGMPFLPFGGGGPGSLMGGGGGGGGGGGSEYGHGGDFMGGMQPGHGMMPFPSSGSMYGMGGMGSMGMGMGMGGPMFGGAGAGVAASGHGGNGSQMGGYPPLQQGMMPPQAPVGPGMRQNRMSTFSMATSVNPFAGPSMNPNPSDEEVFGALRNYLSTQDLMSVTKK